MYWFCHLGTITELNGWDAMNPGHFDQHLAPFYEREVAAGSLTRERAKEILSCLWIKVNNHTAPPKVGITAKESGTYNDFTNINIGGLKRDGSDGVNDVSYIMLEAIDELHLLQPGSNVQISHKTPHRFLKSACRVIRKGYGYPSVFNADEVVMVQVRTGKTLEDARAGGCSGCVEVGAFGKEAYILTGYLNVPKIFEITLNNGRDPLTGDADADAGTVALKYHGFAGENEYDLLVAEDRDRTVVGAGGTRSIGGAILRGDLVVTDTPGDTRVELVTNVSYSWTWNEKNVSGAAEYYNDDGDNQYLAGSLMIEMSPLWMLTPTVIANVDDTSALLQVITQYSLSDNMTFLGSVNVPLGADGTEFGGPESAIPDRYLSFEVGVFAQLAWYF